MSDNKQTQAFVSLPRHFVRRFPCEGGRGSKDGLLLEIGGYAAIARLATLEICEADAGYDEHGNEADVAAHIVLGPAALRELAAAAIEAAELLEDVAREDGGE